MLNHVRRHQGLEGKTPAEAAGIGIVDRNRWLDLIRKGLQAKRQPEMDNPS